MDNKGTRHWIDTWILQSLEVLREGLAVFRQSIEWPTTVSEQFPSE
jgi:hypothetical protein